MAPKPILCVELGERPMICAAAAFDKPLIAFGSIGAVYVVDAETVTRTAAVHCASTAVSGQTSPPACMAWVVAP